MKQTKFHGILINVAFNSNDFLANYKNYEEIKTVQQDVGLPLTVLKALARFHQTFTFCDENYRRIAYGLSAGNV